MTGGWSPFKDEESPVRIGIRKVERSDDELRVDELLAVLREGARFRRRATQLLRDEGLSFVEWRVLRATSQARDEQNDAVSQQAVAQFASIDASSVQKGMRRLESRSLVDIGFDQYGWAQRIVVTQKGRELLRRIESLIARVGV
jgi:DNA-binding MarR family transcriptional regulator